ncbi:RING-H2 zinc finger domain-containing protein [Ditylenchus destructor]|uniref:RING-H2 zinc finger domain-containing protein n=1 Tax=Ditylenchus destructor TaxID=166010 RepID=A0AAD4NJ88_9BILA|nr:RING-H2 zinc finger domain-containing protein [Ditylenchus destructor]
MEDQNGNSKPVKAYIIRKQYEEGIFVVDFWTKHFPRFSVPLSRLNVECDPLTGNCVILSRESRDPTQLHVTKCTDASVLPLKVCENSIELQVKFLPLEEYLYPSRAKENNLVLSWTDEFGKVPIIFKNNFEKYHYHDGIAEIILEKTEIERRIENIYNTPWTIRKGNWLPVQNSIPELPKRNGKYRQLSENEKRRIGVVVSQDAVYFYIYRLFFKREEKCRKKLVAKCANFNLGQWIRFPDTARDHSGPYGIEELELIDPVFATMPSFNTIMLSEEERWQREHEALHAKHKGHDAMHAEMFLIFIIALAIAQIILVTWKRKHFKSYQIATLAGLWVIPPFICIQKGWYRFILTWLIFTIVSGYVWLKVKQPIISGKTPRFVYKYFLFLHKISYVLGILGYLVLMFTLMGVNLVFNINSNTCLDVGICLLFYGLYYGVLGRDFAHICTDALACKIGYFTHEGLPKRILESGICAVCGDELHKPASVLQSNGSTEYSLLPSEPATIVDDMAVTDEETYTLSCNHEFHEFCIRGWVVVGKMQTCPYCKEKVDLKRMFKNPWEKPHLFYGQLLDWIRYLVAWQPLIVFIVQGINKFLGLE